MGGPSDEDLVLALRSGDHESLGVLVGRWEQPLHRFVHRMIHRTEDVQDICQETFLRVLNKAHRFNPGSRFSTWMYQIALNLCRDRLRHKRRWNLLLATDVEVNDDITPAQPSASNDPAEATHQREVGAAVRRALETLPPAQREVLILKEFEGLKFKEIAAILDCPESTVKSRLYGGLDGMREVLMRGGHTAP